MIERKTILGRACRALLNSGFTEEEVAAVLILPPTQVTATATANQQLVSGMATFLEKQLDKHRKDSK